MRLETEINTQRRPLNIPLVATLAFAGIGLVAAVPLAFGQVARVKFDEQDAAGLVGQSYAGAAYIGSDAFPFGDNDCGKSTYAQHDFSLQTAAGEQHVTVCVPLVGEPTLTASA